MPVSVPIAKAGDKAFLDVEIEQIPPDTWSLVILEGLKVVLNARMSTVGAVTKLEGKELEDAHAHAMKIANDNRDKLMAGDLKAKTKATKSDIPREVQTEARRQAREVVRNTIRQAGGKISQYAASDITKWADAVIANDPSYIEKATAAIEARANLTQGIDLAVVGMDKDTILSKVDPKKLKAAADKKAAAKSTLSATQSGKVKPRKRPVAVPGGAIPAQRMEHTTTH